MGIRQRILVTEWDIREIMEWLAYDMACNPEFKERIFKEQALEAQRNNTAEQEAQLIIDMFMGLSGNAINK